ncbi:MAG: Snf7 family protein [Bacillota bacterium]
MGLFKKKKQPSLQEKLMTEGKLNRHIKTIRSTIRTLSEKLKTEQKKAFEAKKENNYPKAQAALASMDVIEQRLDKLYDVERTVSSMVESLDDQAMHRKLLSTLESINETLPKSKRKKKPTSETITMKDTVAYLERLMPEAQTHVEGNLKSVKKDDLDAFFDTKSS